MRIRTFVASLSAMDRLQACREAADAEIRGPLAGGILYRLLDAYLQESGAAACFPVPDIRMALIAEIFRHRALDDLPDTPPPGDPARLEALLDDRLGELRLIAIEDGQITIGGPLVRVMAEAMAQMLEAGDPGNPANYTETRISHDRLGPLVLTLQRVSGRTPHEMRRATESERDALLVALHEAIQSPSGVVPASAEPWHDPDWARRPPLI
jgi:hypothetical protein